MTAEICAVDGKRPTPDGYACWGCANRADGHLGDIIELAPDARLVAAGLVRRGGGGGSNKPGSRPPLNDGATDALDEVVNLLTTLARDVAETRGLQIVSAASGSRMVPDPLIAAARFLSDQIGWLRHAIDGTEPYAIRAFDEIAVCAGRLRGLVNGPGEQKFLGPCHAMVTWDDEGNEIPRDARCEGDVFAYGGAKEGACRECGARWATAKRREWLDGEVRDHAFRASEIEDAYGISANLIRQWATLGRNLVQVHGQDAQGRALYLLSQVLDVAAAQAAKRAEAHAKRVRRAADRAADDERMSA